MAAPAGQNDSIITFGLELAEETEKSVGEIASEVGKDAGAPQAAPEQQQAAPSEADIARIAYEREQAEQAQQIEQSHELEQQGMER